MTQAWRKRILWLAQAKSPASAVAHTLVARVGVLAVNVATGVIVARTLQPSGRGEQSAMTIWPVVFCGLFTAGIPVALRYYVARSPERAARLLSTALVYGIVLGLLACACGAAFIPYWLSKYDPHVVRFAQWLMVIAPATMVAYVLQGYLEARGDFRQANFIVYVPPVTTLVTLVVLVASHRMSPYSSSLAYLVPPVILTVWRTVAARASIRLPIKDFFENSQALFSYGMRAFGIDLLSTLSLQVDQALVAKFLIAADLGVYTVALTISRLLNTVSSSLNIVLFPKASSLEQDAALALVARGARLTLAATGSAAVVLALIVPRLLPIVYGPLFASSARIAQVLLIEVTIGSTVIVLAQAFLSTGRPGVVTALQGVGLLATVPLMLVCIPKFGLLGAAVALLGSTTLRLLFVLASYPLLLKRLPPSLLLTADDVRFVFMKLRRAND